VDLHQDLDPFYRLVRLGETASTNDDARRLAAEGAPEGTLVWAERQSAGRGRRGRRWESPAGNLYMSLVLRPAMPLARCGQIGFLAALAIAETCAALVPHRAVACKWPNDVLIDGRKVAGLLLESEGRTDGAADWLVLGLGVNVASHPEGMEFPATSLAAEGAQDDARGVLGGVAARFAVWYRCWQAEGFAAAREAWLARAAGVGSPVRVRFETHSEEGLFAGLDGEGALLLHKAGESAPARVTSGDLFFPAASETA
jgi:BirA family biotin operon repressor/biotin-[acetyl-CoA-carboxylase] ligase